MKFVLLLLLLGLDKLRARGWSGAKNHRDAPDFSGAHILLSKKEKTIRSTNLQSIDKTMKKLHWIPNIIGNTIAPVIFWYVTYLIMLKLIYLLMDWETF